MIIQDNIEDIVRILRMKKYRILNEDVLQGQIEVNLRQQHIEFAREKRLSKEDRIDFLLRDGIGIEVKINRAESSLILQAGRYLQHAEINSLLLVTIRPLSLPKNVLGKPLINVPLWDRIQAF